MDKDTQEKPVNPLEGAFKSHEEMAVKDVKVEHINILHKVKITYKTPETRAKAIKEAQAMGKRSKNHYGPEGYTINFEESEYVVPITKR